MFLMTFCKQITGSLLKVQLFKFSVERDQVMMKAVADFAEFNLVIAANSSSSCDLFLSCCVKF